MRLTSWILLLVVCLVGIAADAQYSPNNPIKHVVVIVQENRTPDNLFQGLCNFGAGCGPGSSQYHIAARYGWANRMFQTNQGPSYPAHQFLFGGTSAPTAGDDAVGVFVSENGPSSQVGCAAPPNIGVELVRAPCFTHQALSDLLYPHFSWRTSAMHRSLLEHRDGQRLR